MPPPLDPTQLPIKQKGNPFSGTEYGTASSSGQPQPPAAAPQGVFGKIGLVLPGIANRLAAAFGNYGPLHEEQRQQQLGMQKQLQDSTLADQSLNRQHLQQTIANTRSPEQEADLQLSTQKKIHALKPPESEIDTDSSGNLIRNEFNSDTQKWSPRTHEVPNPALDQYSNPSTPKPNYVQDWNAGPPPSMPKTVPEAVHPLPPAPMLGYSLSPAGIDMDPKSPTYGQSVQYARSKMSPQNVGTVSAPAGRGTLDMFAPTVTTAERGVQQPTGETTKEQFRSSRQRLLPGQSPTSISGSGGGSPNSDPGNLGHGSVIGGKAPKTSTDAYAKVLDADQRVKTMQQDLDQIGKNPANAGAFDMDLLSQHIALTFGTTKNVRGGEQLIEHHIHARSLPEDLSVMYNHLKNGGVLSPEQRANFLHLAQTRYATYQQQYQSAQDEAKRGFGMNGAAPPPTLPPVPGAVDSANPLGLGKP